MAKNTLRELFVSIKMKGAKESTTALKKMKKVLKSVIGDFSMFKSMLASMTVAAAFRGIGNAIKSVVREFRGMVKEASNLASIQEDSELRLESAMKVAGDFNKMEFEGMKKFASSLQEVSTVGDESILMGMALAKSLGASNTQAKELTKAAINLSVATGKNFDTSMQQVTQTLGGVSGRLGLIIPELKELTAEELKAGKAAGILNQKFGGLAKKNLKSFGSQYKQLQNIIGDGFEQIGAPINDALLPAVKQLKGVFLGLEPVFTRLGQSIGGAFSIFFRMFNTLGGGDFLGGIIDSVGSFVTDFALLMEDFFFWMRGERSFLGSQLGDMDNVFSGALGSLGEKLGQALVDVFTSAMPYLAKGLMKVIGSFIGDIGTFLISALIRAIAGILEPFLDRFGSTFFGDLKNKADDALTGTTTWQSMAGFMQGLTGVDKSIVTGQASDSINNKNASNTVNSSVGDNITINQNNNIKGSNVGNSTVNQIDQAMTDYKSAKGVR